MANFFPCPNPACTYQFDTDQLPAAAMVTCPICRTRFPYRATAASTQMEAPALVSQEAQPAWHDEESAAAPSADGQAPQREKVNRLVNVRGVPQQNKKQTILMLVGFTAVLITVLIVIMISSRKKFFQPDEEGTTYTNDLFNFRFLRFENKWREDGNLRNSLAMNGFMMKSADLEAWIGLKCIEFDGGKRGPRPNELNVELTKVLRSFGKVQTESASATIGKQSASGYGFSGSLEGTPVYGEAYAFHYKGIGYLMVMWATEEKWDGAKDELVRLRNSFELLGMREKWREQSASVVAHFVEGGDYQLDDVDGIWQRGVADGKPADYVVVLPEIDDKAVMAFRGLDPETMKKKRADKIYSADVIVLEKAGDSVDALKKYLNDKLNKAEGGLSTWTVEPLQKQPFTQAVPAGVSTFRAINSVDRDQRRYYAINVANIGGRSVTAIGWCKELDSDRMGPFVVNFVGSLKERR